MKFRLMVSNAGILCAGVLLLAPAFTSAQEGPPPLRPLLQQLLTGNLTERENAFYAIRDIPHAAARPDVQQVFVQVLQREDDLIESASFHGLGEGYAEYVSYLSGFVYRYAKLNDSEDRPTLLALLPGSGLPNEESRWLATRAALKVGDVIPLASGPRSAIRSDGRYELVAFLRAGREGKRVMSPGSAEAAKEAILAGLKEPDPDDRWATVGAIWMLGDPDDAELLRAVANNDPDATVRRHALRISVRLAKLPPVHHIVN